MSQGILEVDISTSELTLDSASAVNVGTGTATSVNLAATGILTNVQGPLSVSSYSDFSGIPKPGLNPATGVARLYYKNANDGFYYLDHAGVTEHKIASGASVDVLYTALADCPVSNTASYTSLISSTATTGSSSAYTPAQGETIVIDAGGTYSCTSAQTFLFRLIKKPSSPVTLAAVSLTTPGGTSSASWTVHIEFTFRTTSTGEAMGNLSYVKAAAPTQCVYCEADQGAISGISTASDNIDFQVQPPSMSPSIGITCTGFIMSKKRAP